MSSDSSHHTSTVNKPSAVASEAVNATVIAIAMSSIIPGLRCFSSDQPPVRNGQPP